MFIFYNPRRRRLSLLPAGPLSSHSPSTIYTFYSHPLFSASRTLHTRSCLRPHILTTRLDAPSFPSYHPRPHFSTHLGLPIFFVYSPSLITVRKYYLRPPPYLSRRFLPRLYSRPHIHSSSRAPLLAFSFQNPRGKRCSIPSSFTFDLALVIIFLPALVLVLIRPSLWLQGGRLALSTSFKFVHFRLNVAGEMGGIGG